MDPATDREELRMGAMDKIKNTAQEAKGETKEKVGRATDDEQMEAEGTGDKVAGKMKNAGEDVKDAAGKVKDAFTK
jgi:uncharacterized protein YjbJ (UPF0337 family)